MIAGLVYQISMATQSIFGGIVPNDIGGFAPKDIGGFAPNDNGGSVPNVTSFDDVISLTSRNSSAMSVTSSMVFTSENGTVCDECDVAEIFSPPRLSPRADLWGLRGGFSHDLTTGYDLLTTLGRSQSWHELQSSKPGVLIVSPPCTWYSAIQNLNMHRYSADVREARSRDAGQLLGYALRCCKEQLLCGRGFVFEHPWKASSWKLPAVTEFLCLDGVATIDFDQCATGLQGPNGQPIEKRTRLMTNMPQIVEVFSKLQCKCKVKHLNIEGACLGVRLGPYCQVYTPALCDQLLGCSASYIHGDDLENSEGF